MSGYVQPLPENGGCNPAASLCVRQPHDWHADIHLNGHFPDMTESLFLCTTAALFALAIALGWRYLPSDRFQVLAAVPVRQGEDQHWQGITSPGTD